MNLINSEATSRDRNSTLHHLFVASIVGLGAAVILLSLLASWPATVSGAGAIRYVVPGGINSGSCTNSGNPCASVQYALDQAGNGEEIHVAGGTYSGVSARAGVTQSVYISKPVTIRGGYPADFSTPPDPDANPTTLDAQNQGRVFYITNNSVATIEGLRIVNGNGIGAGGPIFFEDFGGGVFVLTATMILRDNHLSNNTALGGGGLYTHGSGNDVTIVNNTISSNHATDWGGGLHLIGSATVMGNLIISNTTPRHGAGIYYAAGNGALINNTILSNTAGAAGGGVFMGAGPIQVADNVVSFNRSGCNDATTTGGGGFYIRESSGTVVNNTISHNFTECNGGGLKVQTGSVLIKSNDILSNSADFYGGGLQIYLGNYGNPTVDGNVIMGNNSAFGGGVDLTFSRALLLNNVIADNHVTDFGSGLRVAFSLPTILHTTIARNTGGDGSGVFASPAIITMTNTIIVGHDVGVSAGTQSTVTMEATLWGSGVWANGVDQSGEGVINSTLDIHGQPMFVNPDGGDYHINVGSAARNAGVDADVFHDIDGQFRPFEGAFDIGADEHGAGYANRVYLPIAPGKPT